MTLLRRAPREVYRVYGEDEFFARVDHDERPEPTAPGMGARRLRRMAGATMLLAVTGAVGGLVVIASLPAASGTRRRAGTGLLSATRSFAASRASRGQVWREPAVSGVTHLQSIRRGDADRVDARARATATAIAIGRKRAVALPRHALVSAQTTAVAVSGQGAAVAAVANSSQPVRMTASASVVQQRSGQSEFGFER